MEEGIKCTKCLETKPKTAFTEYMRPSKQKRRRIWCDSCIAEAGNMKSSFYRKDAWTEPEDTYLVETVLEYIRNGKTQLLAFQDVGIALNRTKGSVDHRWNLVLRQNYVDQIKEAKRIRKFKMRR